jgi:hypothetical protein
VVTTHEPRSSAGRLFLAVASSRTTRRVGRSDEVADRLLLWIGDQVKQQRGPRGRVGDKGEVRLAVAARQTTEVVPNEAPGERGIAMNSTPRLPGSRRDPACRDRADPAAGKRPADCCSRWRKRSRQSPSPQQHHGKTDALPLLERGGVTRQRPCSSRVRARSAGALTSARARQVGVPDRPVRHPLAAVCGRELRGG